MRRGSGQFGADVTELLDYDPGRFEDKREFHDALGGFVAGAARATSARSGRNVDRLQHGSQQLL